MKKENLVIIIIFVLGAILGLIDSVNAESWEPIPNDSLLYEFVNVEEGGLLSSQMVQDALDECHLQKRNMEAKATSFLSFLWPDAEETYQKLLVREMNLFNLRNEVIREERNGKKLVFSPGSVTQLGKNLILLTEEGELYIQ